LQAESLILFSIRSFLRKQEPSALARGSGLDGMARSANG